MTAPLSFPALPGQSWSVYKRPTFATRVANHVSGREVRAPLFSQTLYEFELTFDGLCSDSASPGLGANSLQSLMGLYLQCRGQFGTFLYTDPTDNRASAQSIGAGDGATTSFAFRRTLGGATEPVSWVTSVSNVSLNGVSKLSGWTLVAPNKLSFVHPPLGAPGFAHKLAEDSSIGEHSAHQSVSPLTIGTPVTFTMYVKATERRACRLAFLNGVSMIGCDFDLDADAATPSTGITAASISAVGDGWRQISISGDMAATGAPIVSLALENPVPSQSYPGVAGSGLYFSGGSWSSGSGASAFLPAFSSATGATLVPAEIALPGPVSISADFTYAFECRFLDDQNDFENFMSGLWSVKSLKFRMVHP